MYGHASYQLHPLVTSDQVRCPGIQRFFVYADNRAS